MNKTIPTNWKQKKLGDLFDFKNGVNAEKSAYGSGIPFINVMEVIFNNSLQAEGIPGKVTLPKKQETENLVIKGDVLFNRTSETKHEIALSSVYLDEAPVVFGGFVIRGRSTTDDLTDEFKKYCFRTKHFRRLLIKSGQGAVRSNIGQKDLVKLPFYFPNRDEQNRITSILNTYEQSIEALTEKIQLKKNIKKGLMQELLTGKKRLPAFSGRWQEVKLGDICKVKKGTSFTKKELIKGDVPVIAGGQQPACYHNQSNREGKIITVSASGAYAGYIDYYEIPIFASDCSTIQETTADINFIYAILKSKQNWIYHALQTGGAQPHVYPKDLEKLKIIIPELKDEQTAIAQILTTADDEITALEQKKQKLEDQKKYLLNNLITGQIRTPENLTMNNQ